MQQQLHKAIPVSDKLWSKSINSYAVKATNRNWSTQVEPNQQSKEAEPRSYNYTQTHESIQLRNWLVGRNQLSSCNLFAVASKEMENLLGMLNAEGKREQTEVLTWWRRWQALSWHNV